MKNKNITRIYHNHNLWEEVEYGMYENIDINMKDEQIKKVIAYFNDLELVTKYMNLVILTFKKSCEHNLTNQSINKVAWLGQASVSLYLKIPAEITRLAWNYLDNKCQENANKVAEDIIEKWEREYKNV